MRPVVRLGRQNSLDQVVAESRFSQQDAHPTGQEFQHLGFDFRRNRDRLRFSRFLDREAQVEVEIVFDQRLNCPNRGPAQAKRVFCAGRGQPGGEQTDQRVDPIGERHHQTDFTLRHGLVLFADGGGHFGVFRAAQGILAPDNALSAVISVTIWVVRSALAKNVER